LVAYQANLQGVSPYQPFNLDFSTHADENTTEDMHVPTEKRMQHHQFPSFYTSGGAQPKESHEAARNGSLKLLSNDCKSL
jgi:hypothetical protein